MATRGKRKANPPSTQELVAWLRALRLHQEGVTEPASIPGLDSYAPSYLSGGAVVDHRFDAASQSNVER